MKHLAIVAAAGLVLAGCEATPGLPTIFTGGGGGAAAAQSNSPRQAEFVALVEAVGVQRRRAGSRSSSTRRDSATSRSASSARRSPRKAAPR